jgi:hypothetical protein
MLKVACVEPETLWATHGQDERYVKVTGGPNRRMLQNSRMNCE